MSGDEARPNQTETARYLAGFISPQFTGKTIVIGNGSIQTTNYTISEQANYNTGYAGIAFVSSSDEGQIQILPSATKHISRVTLYSENDPSNAGYLDISEASTGGAAIVIGKNGSVTAGDLIIETNGSSISDWTFTNSNGSLQLPGMLVNTPIADPSAAAGQLWLSSTNVDTLKYSNASAIFNVVATKATSQQTSVTNAAPTTVSFTPPAEAGIYRISGYLNVTTGTTIAAALKITYKDPQGNSRNDGVVFQKAGSATLLTSVVTTGQQTFHETIAIDNSGTAITVADNSGTYTTCVYDLAVVIERLA